MRTTSKDAAGALASFIIVLDIHNFQRGLTDNEIIKRPGDGVLHTCIYKEKY